MEELTDVKRAEKAISLKIVQKPNKNLFFYQSHKLYLSDINYI